MSTGTWIAIASVIVTGLGVILALKGVSDQLRLATFIAYTERHTAVMARMPFEARQPGSGYSLEHVPLDERRAVPGVFRDYFNLCSEELWLAQSGKIDKKTWSIWKLGIQQVAAFPSFATAWGELRQEYVVYADFRQFRDEISAAPQPNEARAPPEPAEG